MSVKEAMKALGGVSRSHIYDLIKRGELHVNRKPSYRAGKGPVTIPKADVDAILARRQQA